MCAYDCTVCHLVIIIIVIILSQLLTYTHRKCGNHRHNDQLVFLSSGNVMLVTLITNGENNFPGFSAKYSQVPAEIQGTVTG